MRRIWETCGRHCRAGLDFLGRGDGCVPDRLMMSGKREQRERRGWQVTGRQSLSSVRESAITEMKVGQADDIFAEDERGHGDKRDVDNVTRTLRYECTTAFNTGPRGQSG